MSGGGVRSTRALLYWRVSRLLGRMWSFGPLQDWSGLVIRNIVMSNNVEKLLAPANFFSKRPQKSTLALRVLIGRDGDDDNDNDARASSFSLLLNRRHAAHVNNVLCARAYACICICRNIRPG